MQIYDFVKFSALLYIKFAKILQGGGKNTKMQSNIYISLAMENDLSNLAKTEDVCFSDAWSENALLSQIKSDYALTLVVKDENANICGYISGGLTPPEAEIFRVATLPEYRRCGIGRFALSEFISLAKEKGCTDFFIEVRESNTPARALYSSFGFFEAGKRKNYYSSPKEDAILLSLKIS